MALCAPVACDTLCSHRSPRARAVWQVVLHADQTKGGSGEPPKTFTFDQVYDDTSQQEVTRPHIHCSYTATHTRDSEHKAWLSHAPCSLSVARGPARSTARGVRRTGWQVLYQETAARIVDSVLEGFNGTIFAYGQTGTGKTFTMEGVNEPPELRGIIPRAFAQVFEMIAARGGENTEF